MSLDDKLKVLNPQQKEAVVHDGGSLLILAGAGSGKTRVITTKIAYLISEKHIDPYAILAVTFTKKAAQEMKDRAINMEPKSVYAQIRTFHSFGAYFLRKYWSEAGVDKNFTVYDDDDMVTLVSKALPSLTKKDCTYIAHKISLAKDYCLTPTSKDFSQIGCTDEFALQYEAYENRLRETGNVDFGDLILLPYLVLKNSSYVRNEIHSRYQVIMVDEYQDSNVAQFMLLQQLAGVDEKTGIYVCVVGDDDQSIYKFRGAEVKNILNFQKQFPETKMVRLETNYRSTNQILACADSVVKNNFQRLGKTLVAHRGDGKKPVLAFLENQDDECDFCSMLIEDAHSKGVPYSEWAILYRTNAQSMGFESTFLRKKIPYQIVGTLKFYEREEVKDIIAWLTFIANPKNEISFRRIINKPARGIGATTQDKIVEAGRGISMISGCQSVRLTKKAQEGISFFTQLYSDFEKMIPDISPEDFEKSKDKEKKLSDLVKMVCEKSGLEDYHKTQDDVAGTQKIFNLQELANSASLYPCTRYGLMDFLDHIELDRTLENESENEKSSDRVTMITLHNTKGLEFPRVIITGMEFGVFPREDKAGDELEEERRLFYVGITRAQNQLYFTSCKQRRMYGQTKFMYPSPFLNEMQEDLVRVLGQTPSTYEPGLAAGEDPIAKKWCTGAQVYHDDYGDGIIVAGNTNADGEYVISVSFESGGIKKFLPKYQKSLIVVEN